MKPIDPTRLAGLLGLWSAGRGPLYLLLARRLRELIEDGRLPAHTVLPPDRTLAAALAVGRTTVVAAYDLLKEEGRLGRRQGKGTWVEPPGLNVAEVTDSETANPMVLHLLDTPEHVVQFTCAAPDVPPPELRAAYMGAAERLAAFDGDIGYHPAGLPALRTALAERYAARGVPTTPDQILVTNGGQHAISLLARVLVAPGARVLIEAPSYPGAIEVFREAAGLLRFLGVGEEGVDPAAFERSLDEGAPAVAYMIPSHQNPTGAVLPPLAKRRVVEAAEARGVPLIDDEVVAELSLTGEEPPPLAAVRPDGAVISIGSLSKVVWGGMRLGWIRANAALIARLARLKAVHDLGGPVLEQAAAVDLLARMPAILQTRRRELRERHDLLRTELHRRIPEWTAPPVPGGQTLWVATGADTAAFAQVAMRYGAVVVPGGALDPTGRSADRLRLPFLLSPPMLTEGVRRLAQAWREYDGRTAPRRALNAVVV